MHEIHLTLAADDGHPLAATLYEPPGAIAAVQINSATGAPRRYYAPYARFLAGQGFAVLSYDYRGIGDSRWHAAAPEQVTMRRWGTIDYASALQWLHARYPRLPLLSVGHSVGGQLLGLAPNNHLIRAALSIAAQSGYWRHWPATLQPLMVGLWHLAIPAAVALTGHLPAALMDVELPGGVAREWARWGRHREFFVDERGRSLRAGFERYRGRLLMVSIADDRFYAPPRAVTALSGYFRNADIELRTLDPCELGIDEIGHFGFFRSRMPRTVWQQTADWLRAEALPALARAA
ncbi:alpha/beta fold hydrolase [Fontimonas sp. SYSU GA230001]|uniref:alpha/beta hydrolase family protein n=1 Tax=Fontimonas sp. SYSU GA230001 TaxID=3142450 RepID=UPI0032B37E98